MIGRYDTSEYKDGVYTGNWVATEWYQNQSQEFKYKIVKKDTTNRTVTIHWYLGTQCNDSHRSPTYYVCKDKQLATLTNDNDKTIDICDISSTKTQDGHTVYRGFTDKDSWLDNHRRGWVFEDFNGDYTGIHRWVEILGYPWKDGTVTLPVKADGTLKFKVSGSFAWYVSTRRKFSITFTHKNALPVTTYTIKYNKGTIYYDTISGMPSKGSKKYGNSYTIAKAPSSKYHTFKCWNTKADGSGTSYKAGATYKTNKDLTLYAIWTPKTINLTFNANGGLFDTNSISQGTFNDNTEFIKGVKYENKIGEIATCSRKGYEFLGWKGSNINPSVRVVQSIDGTYSDLYITKDTIVRASTGEEARYYQLELDPSITTKVNALWTPDKVQIRLNARSTSNFDNDSWIMEYTTLRYIKDVYYDQYIVGDFTYNLDGFNCIGWSIKPHKPYLSENDVDENTIYIKNGNFIKDQSGVKSDIVGNGSLLNLYPILVYSTTLYVHTNNKWRLVMPYVYKNGKWRLSLTHGYVNNKWRL